MSIGKFKTTCDSESRDTIVERFHRRQANPLSRVLSSLTFKSTTMKNSRKRCWGAWFFWCRGYFRSISRECSASKNARKAVTPTGLVGPKLGFKAETGLTDVVAKAFGQEPLGVENWSEGRDSNRVLRHGFWRGMFVSREEESYRGWELACEHGRERGKTPKGSIRGGCAATLSAFSYQSHRRVGALLDELLWMKRESLLATYLMHRDRDASTSTNTTEASSSQLPLLWLVLLEQVVSNTNSKSTSGNTRSSKFNPSSGSPRIVGK
ncbi:hypothetical protein BT96DRAFT_948974 [Gymnopus androsaceus JB14]|uniref:Uncharacterized protein n=1 Tax=Gymnopus androsaceus JB14 TaxID=1447944 RepID=A0A6A4GLJ3_9AGAR|nr:hypothetical protein BT96DRAFT_948974 [Gymnopus androsaceus JB14]